MHSISIGTARASGLHGGAANFDAQHSAPTERPAAEL